MCKYHKFSSTVWTWLIGDHINHNTVEKPLETENIEKDVEGLDCKTLVETARNRIFSILIHEWINEEDTSTSKNPDKPAKITINDLHN